jgi:hypothetical protein
MSRVPRARRRVSSSTLVERLALLEPPIVPAPQPDQDAPVEERALAIRARLTVLEQVLADPGANLAAQRAAARALPGDACPLRLGLIVKVDALLSELSESLFGETALRSVERSQAIDDALEVWDLEGYSTAYHARVARIDEVRDHGPSLPSLIGVEGDFDDDPPGYGDTPWYEESDERTDLASELADRAGLTSAARARTLFRSERGARIAWYGWGEREGLLASSGLRDAREAVATWEQVFAHRQALRLDLEKLALLDERRDIANGSYGEMCEWGREVGAIGPLAARFLLRHTLVPENWTGT